VELEEIQKIDKSAISEDKNLLLIIESYGNMPAKDIFLGAISAIEDNLKEFEKFVNKAI
jgi:hypothetical protein